MLSLNKFIDNGLFDEIVNCLKLDLRVDTIKYDLDTKSIKFNDLHYICVDDYAMN